MQPLVSVIIPFKTETIEFDACLKHLASQTYQKFEIILVADGAEAEAIDIAERFEWPFKKLIKLTDSIGQSLARNHAIPLAQGKYIAIQDADDASLSNRFELQVKFLESHPNISVLGSAATLRHAKCKWDVYSQHKDIYSQLAINNPMVHSTVMLRKEVLVNYPYDHIYNTAEDYDLFTKIKDKYQMANLSKSLLIYNEPDSNKPTALDQKMKARILREQNNIGVSEKYVTALHHFCELSQPIQNNEMEYLKNWFKINKKMTVFQDQFLRYGLKYPMNCSNTQLIKAWIGAKLMRKASVLKRLF